MFINGAKFEIKIKIKLGDEEFLPGLKGTVTGSVKKMVGKAYSVEFEDGRKAVIHMVIMNNQTQVLN